MRRKAEAGVFYVYEHWRPDKKICFWVGKGRDNQHSYSRAYCFRRSRHYNNVVSKLKRIGVRVEVKMIRTELSEDAAFTLEKKRIAFWRSRGVRLTNQTDGGDGGAPTPSVIKRRNASIKKAWSNPELLARHSVSQSAIARIVQAKPEVRAKNSAGVKAARAKPDVKAKHAYPVASHAYLPL